MADKSKSIKTANDKELDDLIKRLRKESEAQGLIEDIKRRSLDGYTSYDQRLGVSTEAAIEDLYHVGILGMHWGRRKSNGMDTTKVHSNSTSEDHIKKATLSAKKMHEMSNAEIKAFNERMNLEKQYKEFTKKQRSPVEKLVVELVGGASKEVAKTYTSKYMTKGIEALLKKAAKP